MGNRVKINSEAVPTKEKKSPRSCRIVPRTEADRRCKSGDPRKVLFGVEFGGVEVMWLAGCQPDALRDRGCVECGWFSGSGYHLYSVARCIVYIDVIQGQP